MILLEQSLEFLASGPNGALFGGGKGAMTGNVVDLIGLQLKADPGRCCGGASTTTDHHGRSAASIVGPEVGQEPWTKGIALR